VIAPDPDFAPNPARAIHVQGPFDQQLLYRLTPEIIRLLGKGREPITVYIDSPGGPVVYMEALRKLLGTSTQTFAQPCRIITVGTSLAASAAADMLASGDYALAYPETVIVYHGIRVPGDRPLTVEETLSLAQRLRAGNESYAMGLAREAEFRFIFRFISLKDQFATVRQQHPDKRTDLQCLFHLISEKLSDSANEVLGSAYDRYIRYNALLLTVVQKSNRKSGYKTAAAMEAAQIKAIVDFEMKDNKKDKDWGFLPEGIQRLSDDFLLLHEYLRMFQSERFRRLCSAWSDFLLSPEERQEIADTPEAERPEKIVEKVRPQLRPIWSFFVALCYVLQRGENQLSATDAFWLGLIDEVIGIPELPSLRLFLEHSKETAKQKQDHQKEAGEAKADAATGAA
jgi:ATP-dependent protease ClpP protease subunit